MSLLNRLFYIDNIALDVHLLSILQDRDMYKNLMSQRGQEAQSLLNILQEVTRCFTRSLVILLAN
jgi:hypothetical protein